MQANENPAPAGTSVSGNRLRHTAELANQTKDRFLAHVSHDLRRPLTAIVGYADLLRRNPSLDLEGHDQCELIQSQGWHLSHLIDDLLDTAAIRAGEVQIKPAPLGLPALLEDVSGIARADAGAKGLAFVPRFAADLPEVIETDGQRLRQVLLNLLDNAIKYTDQGRILLHARVDDRSGEGIVLGFAVEDTGPGIAEEDRERIFAPFEQCDPDQPGAGLGLAICRELTRLLGGRLSLDSAPGRGSRFELSLPVAVPAPMAVPSRLDLAALLDFAGSGARALILDWCLDIVAVDARFEPFAERVRGLLEGPGLDALIEWLERQ